MFKSKFVKRLGLPIVILVAMVATVYAIVNAFNDNLTFFYTPTQLLAGNVPQGRSIRIGGLVERGSLKKESGSLLMHFTVTDQKSSVSVQFSGIAPDLFKEGKGVVAEGKMQQGVFVATEILAKHDENYMPPQLKK